MAAISQGTAALLAFAWFPAGAGRPVEADYVAAVLAGLGSGLGNVCIYYGLAGGRMAVVAPLSAIAAALLPLIVGLSLGERPTPSQLAGVIVAIPAVWLVAGGASARHVATRRDIALGLAAGIGFGIQFSALGHVGDEAGLLPVAVSQLVSVAAIVIAAAALSVAWIPSAKHSWLAVVPGLLAGIATISFQLSVQKGLLSIAAVLTSLYPAVTVIMAMIVLHERLFRAQRAGVMLATAAMALIASG